MADITADMVKTLREQTGAGLMDCKTALKETDGDLGKATEYLRKKGFQTMYGHARADLREYWERRGFTVFSQPFRFSEHDYLPMAGPLWRPAPETVQFYFAKDGQ